MTTPTTFTLKFTTPGNYEYNCLVHSTMKGWVHVQAAGAPYPHSQDYYNAQAAVAEGQTIGSGFALRAVGIVDAVQAGAGNVTAGIGKLYSTGSIMVTRFLPTIEVVHAGQTVTFDNRDPEAPHTVTFNLKGFDAQNPLIAFQPINASNGSATMSSPSEGVNSGVLGAGAPTTFKVKFTSPGLYSYYCALHDNLGMKGEVVVVP